MLFKVELKNCLIMDEYWFGLWSVLFVVFVNVCKGDFIYILNIV